METSRARRFSGAAKLHDEALKLNPNNALAYYGRGTAYYGLRQYKLAIQDLNKALSLLEHPIIYHNRGLCYQELGDKKKAQADFAKAKELGYKG